MQRILRYFRRNLRKIGDTITFISLFLIAVSVLGLGLYYGVLNNAAWPTWAGDVFTTLSGGILALLGSYLALTIGQRNKRRSVELKQRSYQVKPYRIYLKRLYYMLSRKVYAQITKNHELGERVDVDREEITRFIRSMPPLGFMYLLRDERLSREVQQVIEKGFQLLTAQVNDTFYIELDDWRKCAKILLEEMDQYEQTAL